MTTTNNESTNLLGVFDKIEVKNEEKISADDLLFCKEQQSSVEQALAKLDKWYGIFREASQEFTESHKVKFLENGSVEFSKPYKNHSLNDVDYQNYEFLPFDNINKAVEKRQNIIREFVSTIIKYFNKAYNLSVPFPDTDFDKLPLGFTPKYMQYVDLVIVHLGGRSFRNTAEDELIRRVQTCVHRYDAQHLPDLKGKSIIFQNFIYFDSFSMQYGNHKVEWSDIHRIEALCAGLAFFSQNRLNGDSEIISGFDREKVNITDWYELSTSPARYMKFYKNGRVDVKFKDTASAEECFHKLKLDEL